MELEPIGRAQLEAMEEEVEDPGRRGACLLVSAWGETKGREGEKCLVFFWGGRGQGGFGVVGLSAFDTLPRQAPASGRARTAVTV